MSIWLVYAAKDGTSRFAELKVARGQLYGDPPAETFGWRTMVWDSGPRMDDFHVSKGNGSIQTVLSGQLRINVSGGEKRSHTGKPGDIFVFTDLTGDGHQAERVGDEPMQAINIRLGDSIEAVKRSFAGWPADAFDA